MRRLQGRARLVQRHAVEPGFAMHFFGRYQFAQQRLGGTGIHRKRRLIRPIANNACVFAGVVQAHIARHRGDGNKIHQPAPSQTVRHQNGRRIVLAGVGVDNQFDFGK